VAEPGSRPERGGRGGSRLVTLLTDFGTADHFVAAMKGVLLSHDPGIRTVDVTHDVPPQDVRAGAFTLLAVHADFPAGTVHVAVVDPGVGSERRAIAAEAGGRFYVGPDNGVLGYVLRQATDARVFHLDEARWLRSARGATFHGRDLFAPVAAALATGTPVDRLGTAITDPVLLESPLAAPGERGEWIGSILHVDRFGNCITSFTRETVPPAVLAPEPRLLLRVGGTEIRTLRRFFADEAAGSHDGVFAIWGSAGYLEIAAFGDSAARRLGVGAGTVVRAES
jgi:S-adenosyl-L-methionine hydrolase (adenosine-forming)